jgi:hypothetical protein
VFYYRISPETTRRMTRTRGTRTGLGERMKDGNKNVRLAERRKGGKKMRRTIRTDTNAVPTFLRSHICSHLRHEHIKFSGDDGVEAIVPGCSTRGMFWMDRHSLNVASHPHSTREERRERGMVKKHTDCLHITFITKLTELPTDEDTVPP